MLRRPWWVVCILIVAAYFGRPAWGEEDPVLAEAKQHYEKGRALYLRGEYRAAISEYREADRLRPSPFLTYNVGLAFEKLGECASAIQYFERYLAIQPKAGNRADTEHKIAGLRQRQSRDECADSRQASPAPAEKYTPPRAESSAPAKAPTLVFEPPAKDETIPTLRAGLHPHSFGITFGGLIGGLGNIDYENTGGLHLRLGYLFPMIALSDGRSILQGELLLGFAYFGFSAFDVIVPNALGGGATQLGQNGSGSAMALLGGFGVRANFYLSDRIPLTLVPGIAVGLTPQIVSASFDTIGGGGRCSQTSVVLAPFVNIDLALRYELAAHHAITLSPANFYIIFPGVNGGAAPFECLGDSTSANTIYKLEDTTLHWGIGFGYQYQY